MPTTDLAPTAPHLAQIRGALMTSPLAPSSTRRGRGQRSPGGRTRPRPAPTNHPMKGLDMTTPQGRHLIRDEAARLAHNPDQEEWGTGGLELHWDNEGEDRELSLEVSVHVGSIKPGDRAQLVRWPNRPAPKMATS